MDFDVIRVGIICSFCSNDSSSKNMNFNKSRIIFYIEISSTLRGSLSLQPICRDNAVYRSNSFKFERRGGPVSDPAGAPAQPVRQTSHVASIIDQVIQTKKPNRVSRRKKEVILRSILNIICICICMDFLILEPEQGLFQIIFFK